MERAGDGVRIERTSYARELAALGVFALAGLSAFLLVAGPSLLQDDPPRRESAGDGALRRVPVVPPPASARPRPHAALAENAANAERAAASGSGPLREGTAAARSAPGVPPPSGGGDPSARGSMQARARDSIGAAIDRAIARGWLTVDPPGSPPSGMALFPAPGTMPLLEGVIVPDGFELPPGYVRHHQVTDDGEPLPPILMYSPDYEWVDENGEVLPTPPDGVVPPEHVPEGMPVELLTPPETGAAPADPWSRPRRSSR